MHYHQKICLHLGADQESFARLQFLPNSVLSEFWRVEKHCYQYYIISSNLWPSLAPNKTIKHLAILIFSQISAHLRP